MDIISNIFNNIECQICFEKFIKLTNDEYYKFIEKNKNILPEIFEDNTCCRCYEDRFECLTCKNTICRKCYWNFKNHKYIPDIRDYEFFNYVGLLDENGFADGCAGEDCPIICPFCKTKDYKIYYGNKIPYELLNEIKNLKFK